jgi:F-type H+-transporting ATPase subunit delta
MKNRIIIKRYVEAFMAYAGQASWVSAAVGDFKNMAKVLQKCPELLKFLQAPEITGHQKEDFIDRVLGGDFSREFAQFLKLLLEKSRIEFLPGIVKYALDTYSHGNQVEASLKSVFPIDPGLVERIKLQLESGLNRKLKLTAGLDPELLGGVQVTIGNMVIDGSVRRRLKELEEKMETARV